MIGEFGEMWGIGVDKWNMAAMVGIAIPVLYMGMETFANGVTPLFYVGTFSFAASWAWLFSILTSK